MTQPQVTVKPRHQPGFPVAVPINKRVEIARNLEVGTLIYNSDSTNAVWLSSSEMVAVNQGIRLGAFGTLHWIGGPCYGIVDTGVTSPVVLQVSADSQDLINPVDTATAVAIALFAQGITTPTNNYDMLYNGSVSGAGATIDVTAYASVHIFLSNTDNTSVTAATFTFVDPASGLLIDHGLLSAETATAAPSWPDWTLPVCAPQLKLISPSAALNALVVGTNRSLPKRVGSDMYPARRFRGTLAANAVANTVVPLLGIDNNTNNSIPLIDCSNYNGLVTYDWFVSAGPNIAGQLRAKYRDSGGGLLILNAWPGQNYSTTAVYQLFGHPYAYTKWEFLSAALQGAVASQLDFIVMPAGPPL